MLGTGNSRRNMVQSVGASLRRLDTDRIDLLWVHFPDTVTPAEEVVRALDDLVRAGKILHGGFSNFAASRTARAATLAELRGYSPIAAVQLEYSLVERTGDRDVLPMAEALGLGAALWSPLGGGLLTGKYGATKRPEAGRLMESQLYIDRYSNGSDFATAEAFTQFAAEAGMAPATLAVAWVMSHPGITAPIIGARNLTQLEGSLAALNVEMTPELRTEISALSATPPPANDRTETLNPNWK